MEVRMGRGATIFSVCLVAIAFLSTPSLSADVLYIDLSEAYMFTGPGVDYDVLGKVTKDEPLAVISCEGDWFRVRKGDGTDGWIHRFVFRPEDTAKYQAHPVDTGPPVPDTSPGETTGDFLDSLKTGFMGSGDYSITGSAGTRGIEVEEGGGGQSKNYYAVDYMESFYISDYEIINFIDSGGLNR
jgi:uncharacterized protein YgiM (DUF1202 family)